MTSQTEIADTNVILIANGQHQDVSPACVINCISKLQTIVKQGRIALDEGFLILMEYQNKTQTNRGKGLCRGSFTEVAAQLKAFFPPQQSW